MSIQILFVFTSMFLCVTEAILEGDPAPGMNGRIVRVMNGRTVVCSAAFVSEHWILMLSKCIQGNDELKILSRKKEVKVEEKILKDHLALVKVDKKEGDWFQLADKEWSGEEMSCSIAGYGSRTIFTIFLDDVHNKEVRVSKNCSCSGELKANEVYCTAEGEENMPCRGDQGSPLVCDSKISGLFVDPLAVSNCKVLLCGLYQVFGVFLKIEDKAGWIKGVIKDDEKKEKEKKEKEKKEEPETTTQLTGPHHPGEGTVQRPDIIIILPLIILTIQAILYQ